MKKSELTIVGEYRLTPDAWGNQVIMIDEDVVAESVRDAFDMDRTPDPDEDRNDLPVDVEIGVDEDGQHYAITEPVKLPYGEMRHQYRACEKPEDATYGSIMFTDTTWSQFDDED